jgi:bifunctional polynucleotide phosphatase/kinase
MELIQVGSVYLSLNICDNINNDQVKLAMFDLDGTLIKTKSGAVHAKTADDWEWLYPNVPQRLGELVVNGYELIIITNQAGLTSGSNDIMSFKSKLKTIWSSLPHTVKNHLSIYIASARDYYRKPHVGIWDMIRHDYGLTDTNRLLSGASFYCGDAAGRSGDFAITDRYFANNIGVDFYVPEQIFLDHTVSASVALKHNHYRDGDKGGFNPYDFIVDGKNDSEYNIQPLDPKIKHLVLLVGAQATGKTTFALSDQFAGWTWLNQDTLKTSKKMLNGLVSARDAGQNIIIDCTNPTVEHRAKYINLVKSKGYYITTYFFDLPKLMSFHMNHYRHAVSKGKYPLIPKIAIHSYYKKLQPPQESEGINNVIIIQKLLMTPSYECSYQFEL